MGMYLTRELSWVVSNIHDETQPLNELQYGLFFKRDETTINLFFVQGQTTHSFVQSPVLVPPCTSMLSIDMREQYSTNI